MINIKIAFKNIFRNKRRSLLTMACMVSGIITIIVVGGYYAYNYWGLRESLIRSQYAHIQIYKKGYLANKDVAPFDYMIENGEEIIAAIKKDPRVLVVASRVKLWAVMDSGNGTSQIVEVRGIQSDLERLIFTFITKREGEALSGKNPGQMELGGALARELGIQTGETAYISTVSSRGEQNVLQFETCGTVSSYSADFDRILVNINLEMAQVLADTEGVHEIVVLLKDTDQTSVVLADLKKLCDKSGWDLELTNWEEQAGYYRQVVQYYGGFFKIILFIICVVSFFTTLNTVIMSTFERITEIGTMRSFGATKSGILKMMLFEGLFLGFFGAVIGILISVGLAQTINALGGIHLPAPPGMSTDLFIKIKLVPVNFIISGILALCVPVAAILVPALKTTRMEIVHQILFNEMK